MSSVLEDLRELFEQISSPVLDYLKKGQTRDLVRRLPWVPVVLLLLWWLSAPGAGIVRMIGRWVVFILSVAAAAIGSTWIRDLARERQRGLPSFLQGLIDLATQRTPGATVLLVTGLILAGLLIQVLTSGIALAPFIIAAQLCLVAEIAVGLNLLRPPVRGEPLAAARTPALICLSRLPEPQRLQGLLETATEPTSPKVWQSAFERAERLYARAVAASEKVKLPVVNEAVRLTLEEEAGRFEQAETQAIWRQMAALAATPLFATLRAMKYHRCEHLWVLVTPDTEETVAALEAVANQVVGDIRLHRIVLANPHDLAVVRQAVEQAFDEAAQVGLQESEVTVDITGGDSLTAAGAVLACARRRRPVQYLRQDTCVFTNVPVTARTLSEAIGELGEQLPTLIPPAAPPATPEEKEEQPADKPRMETDPEKSVEAEEVRKTQE